MLQKCVIKGKEVEYDDREFEFSKHYGCLRYIGDGEDVRNPKGNTTCRRMFTGYKGSFLELGNFDTSNVTDMKDMFSHCDELVFLDISSFNTSKVISMAGMFYRCRSLRTLNICNIDTSNVRVMDNMFDGCRELRELKMSNLDTSKVFYMTAMFQGCNSLQSLNLSSFDTSKVKSMRNMFFGCSSLNYLDISNFSVSKTTSVENMLGGCNIKFLTLRKELPNVDFSCVGQIVRGVCEEKLSAENNSSIENDDLSKIFTNCSSYSLGTSGFEDVILRNMSGFLYNCSGSQLPEMIKDLVKVGMTEMSIYKTLKREGFSDCELMEAFYRMNPNSEIVANFCTKIIVPDAMRMMDMFEGRSRFSVGDIVKLLSNRYPQDLVNKTVIQILSDEHLVEE